jgi:sterol 3beta-glucosyltransferase
MESDGGLPEGGEARQVVADRVEAEAEIAEEEERVEISKAAEESTPYSESHPYALATPLEKASQPKRQSEENVGAALREGDVGEEEVEDRMAENPAEKKRVRREKLAERLQEVFGLEERETVLEEMRCWLLRSVSEWWWAAHERVNG